MATAATVFEDRRMSIGRVFQRAFSTIGHNPGVVLGIAAIVGAVPSVVMNLVMQSIRGGDSAALATRSSEFWGAMILSWVFAVVLGALVQGALTRAVVADHEGHRATFGECLAAALRVVLPLIGLGIIFAIAVGIGFVLLVVPGIIVMIAWSVAGPAVVVERDGVFTALVRSGDLTKGSRWKIFGLFLVLLVIYLLLFMVLGVVGLGSLSATSPQGFGIVNLISSAITAVVFNLLWGTIQPSLYIELREAKEGGSLENLEHVFA